MDRERHGNSFDHLRLAAAFAVLFYHQFYVYQRPWSFPQIDLGAWAVGVFFAISGYVNTHSLLGRRSVGVFLLSRALRLYPALIVCIGATVLVGALITTWPLASYLGRETLDFFWRNSSLFLGQRNLLPGVFESNPAPDINASLWTLPVEACFYITLAGAAALLRFERRAIGVAALIVGIALIGATRLTIASPTVAQVGVMFLTGALMAAASVSSSRTMIARAATASALVGLLGGWALGLSIGVAVLTVMAGRVAMPRCLRLPMDVSYGVYLSAFPLQQIVVLLELSFYPGLAVASLLTLGTAILCARWIEAPALGLAQAIKTAPVFHPAAPALCVVRT